MQPAVVVDLGQHLLVLLHHGIVQLDGLPRLLLFLRLSRHLSARRPVPRASLSPFSRVSGLLRPE